MRTSDFDYELPPELIAQEPLPERTSARMLVLRRDGGGFEHRTVRDLPELLTAGDLLVLNDTRVFAARAFGTWSDTPGRVEILLVEPADVPGDWMALCRSSRPVRPGRTMVLADGRVRAEVLDKDDEGRTRLRITSDGDLFEILDEHGVPPVPPYIHREAHDARVQLDRERYQTVYARERGAVAAPTAGLHFTPELFDELAARGIARTHVTLHVGPGTFKPVKTDSVEDHVMDPERYVVPPAAAEAIAAARARGGRVVAVGSTSVRTLETAAAAHGGELVACEGRSSLFIRPPYSFLATDAMLTNFHLPRSTLLMMISALAGRERILAAYAAAIRERYRFYSYGDCMLIL
jgi:S-adenosylmethionine:tRNA ribosyltransferase-isomerase